MPLLFPLPSSLSPSFSFPTFTSSLCGGKGFATSERRASAKIPVDRLVAKFHSISEICGA